MKPVATVVAMGPSSKRSAAVQVPSSPKPQSTQTLPILLTPAEVADLLRTSRRAIYAMAERAQLPGQVRLGRRLLFRREALLDFISENSVASPGENPG